MKYDPSWVAVHNLGVTLYYSGVCVCVCGCGTDHMIHSADHMTSSTDHMIHSADHMTCSTDHMIV